MLINDLSGGNLQVDKFQLSLAYHKKLGKNNFHIGIQPGYTLKSINKNETFPSQFDMTTGQFNSGLATNETDLKYNLGYFDLNGGIGYDRKLSSRVEIFTSLAMYHINAPKETFLASSNTLKARNIFSLGVSWFAAKKVTLQPSLCMMGTDKASEFLFGARAFYSFGKDYSISKSLFLGAYGRKGFSNLTDAFYVVLGANWKNYYGGVSYDFNISTLKTASNYRGAIELSFIYTGISTRVLKSQIPCDRY